MRLGDAHVSLNSVFIGSTNSLSPVQRQATNWPNADLLSMGPLGINFNEILIQIQTLSLRKAHLKLSSTKLQLLCLGLNVLMANINMKLHTTQHNTTQHNKISTVSVILENVEYGQN